MFLHSIHLLQVLIHVFLSNIPGLYNGLGLKHSTQFSIKTCRCEEPEQCFVDIRGMLSKLRCIPHNSRCAHMEWIPRLQFCLSRSGNRSKTKSLNWMRLMLIEILNTSFSWLVNVKYIYNNAIKQTRPISLYRLSRCGFGLTYAKAIAMHLAGSCKSRAVIFHANRPCPLLQFQHDQSLNFTWPFQCFILEGSLSWLFQVEHVSWLSIKDRKAYIVKNMSTWHDFLKRNY